MDLLGHKLLALFLVLVVIFIGTALPIKLAPWFLSHGKLGHTVLSAVMCFGGGFFLGTLLLHNLPETIHLITDYVTTPCDTEFSVGYFIVGLGFFIMMFIEKGLMDLTKWNANNKTDKTEVHEVYILPTDGKTTQEKTTTPKLLELRVVDGEENSAMEIDESPLDITTKDQVLETPTSHSHSEAGHSHSHLSGSSGNSAFLLLALSVDSVLEGLNLGLQPTSQGVWQMVATILSHEVVIGFGLGLQLIKYNHWPKALAMSFAFGLMVPIGITTGLIIDETGGDSIEFKVAQGILLAITGGVFLYVTFFDILMHELVNEMKLINILAILLGYSIMALVMAFSHGHSHGGGHSHGDSHMLHLFHEGSYHTDNETTEIPCLF